MRVAHPSIEVVNTVKNLPLLLKHQVVNVRLTRGYDRCDTNVRVGLNTAEHQARRKLAVASGACKARASPHAAVSHIRQAAVANGPPMNNRNLNRSKPLIILNSNISTERSLT